MEDGLVRELEEIGLSEKEARVYLASLELGSSTAQSIAAKATVPRPTTYIMIESLIQRGLMSSFQKGKKRYFISEDPRLLKDIFQNRLNILVKKGENINQLIPKILSVSKLSEMPRVRMLEGEEGLKFIQQDLLTAQDIVSNIVSLDDARNVTAQSALDCFWKKIRDNNISIRTLYTKNEGIDIFGKKVGCDWESRKIPSDKYEFKGEITIYDNKVAGLTFGGCSIGVVIESEEIASTARVLFNLAWNASDK
ncbi:MAG: helix-turn-helix domain-containing protein [Patescibacteria group bacterium]|nr:helix-turn-helix domain-containing protein [Patescibacteria group bacterium]